MHKAAAPHGICSGAFRTYGRPVTAGVHEPVMPQSIAREPAITASGHSPTTSVALTVCGSDGKPPMTLRARKACRRRGGEDDDGDGFPGNRYDLFGTSLAPAHGYVAGLHMRTGDVSVR